jgi:hypothetical protein
MTHLAHFATERALASVVPIQSLDTAPAILSVAEALQPDLAQGFQIDALRLRVEMERAFGGVLSQTLLLDPSILKDRWF